MAQKIHQILSASKGHSLPTDINGLYLPAHRQNLLLDVVEYCIGVRRQRLSATPWVSSLKELLCLSSLSKDRVISCLSPPFNKLHYFLQSWEPLPSLNWKDSSVSLNCTTTGSSFLDIIAKFQVFISWESPWAVSNLQRFLSIVFWKAWSINSYLCHYMQLSNMLRATILKGLPHGNSIQMEFRLFSHTIMDADFWAFFLFICNNDIEKQKYRNTQKGKKNKKLNGYYLDQTYVILIYHITAYN